MAPSISRRILLLGDARQVHLVRWEHALRERGFDMCTVSLEPAGEIAGSSERIYLPNILPQFVRYPAAVPLLRRIIRRFDPVIINAHFLPNYGVMAAMSGFHPWVLSTWGSDIMLVPDKSLFHMQRTRRVIESADHITSDAEVMSRRLLELGASRDRVTTFPFGVDRAVFHPVELDGGRPGPRIVSNRKLERVYGVDTIIAAFPAVLRENPAAHMTVAGSGSLRSELQSAAARVARSDSVRFVGDVRHADMPQLLRDHDIYVSTSFSDTTSVSLLEAIACGLFPIVSDIAANHEWIVDGENGLLVPTDDEAALSQAINRSWRDAELRARARGLNQEITRERADWSQTMTVVVDLFDRILSRDRA